MYYTGHTRAMPNKRKEGWIVTTFSAPAELVAAAKTKARAEGMNLSEVIRAALRRFIGDPDRGDQQ